MSNLMSSDAQRAQFLNDTVLSSSPARLLTMLYDRLVLDLDRAGKAQLAGDLAESNTQLTHAQDIVAELLVTLDVTAWDGGPGLHALYTHLLGELIRANITRDPQVTAACRATVEPLRAAWHEAAASLTASAARSSAANRSSATATMAGVGGVLGVG